MNFQTLQSIYPDSKLSHLPYDEKNFLAIPVNEGVALIDRNGLSDREEKLLITLLPNKKISQSAIEHQWYRILFKNEPINTSPCIRVIQLQLKTNPGFLKKEWQHEIKDMFPDLLDSFFLDEQQAFIIEEKKDITYSAEEIFGLFQALDSDFDVYSQIFVGAFHIEPSRFYENFQQERLIFQNQLEVANTQKEFSFTQSVIDYLVGDSIKNNILLRSLYQEWFADNDIVTILQSLWRNQGNVSSTSKELFLHRNTLLYRLEKFQEATKLDVKNMDDLMLCHLLIDVFGKGF